MMTKLLSVRQAKIAIPILVIFILFSCSHKAPTSATSKRMDENTTGADSIIRQAWGNAPDGKPADLYTLKNKNGLVVKVSSYGGIVTSIMVPDRNGVLGDVVLGYDKPEGYKPTGAFPYFGGLIGRYANRIAHAMFKLEGVTYKLAPNNNENSLHGGLKGFDKVHWEVDELKGKDSVGLGLSYLSKDGEEGYPGNLKVKVMYILTDSDELKIDYFAITDKPTVINLTNHSYFNLSAGKSDDILGHQVQIFASRYTPVDKTLIPTGKILPVYGTPMDFTKAHAVGTDLAKVPGGYDHNFVLDHTMGNLNKAASVYDPISGRVMDIMTTQPGIQFYTGNFLDGSLTGKGGIKYTKHYGMAFETQHFPDSPNQPSFPSVELKEGKPYHELTVYKFSIKK